MGSVSRAVRQLYLDGKKCVWFRDTTAEGQDQWIQLAGELRKAGSIVSWLKFSKQWDSVEAFIRRLAPQINHLRDAALLSHFLAHYPQPIPLDPDAELYIHQASSRSIVAKMVRPRFLYGLGNLRTDTRRVACPGAANDWYMQKRLNDYNCCILGTDWSTRGLPEYRYASGGILGGQGTCSKVLVAGP